MLWFCGSDPLIANPRVNQAPSNIQRPHRDQWIAPTFERHFGEITWFDSAISIPVGPMNHVLFWQERSTDREPALRSGGLACSAGHHSRR
jgi:hypothetical protein